MDADELRYWAHRIKARGGWRRQSHCPWVK
jgi:hypothetical protein